MIYMKTNHPIILNLILIIMRILSLKRNLFRQNKFLNTNRLMSLHRLLNFKFNNKNNQINLVVLKPNKMNQILRNSNPI